MEDNCGVLVTLIHSFDNLLEFLSEPLTKNNIYDTKHTYELDTKYYKADIFFQSSVAFESLPKIEELKPILSCVDEVQFLDINKNLSNFLIIKESSETPDCPKFFKFCIDNKAEWVPLFKSDKKFSSDLKFPGLARCREALEVCPWPNLIMKNSPKTSKNDECGTLEGDERYEYAEKICSNFLERALLEE